MIDIMTNMKKMSSTNRLPLLNCNINAFFDFTRENKIEILKSLKITDNHIEVYILKSFPKISMTSPLKVNKKVLAIAIIIGVILPSILGYLLITNQNIFDLLSGVLK